MRLWMPLWVVLMGCTAPSSPSPKTDDIVDPPVLDWLDPDSGPPNGGTEVQLWGSNFVEGETRVWFDDTELSVDVINDELLHLVTPPIGYRARVDVYSQTPHGEDLLTGGFLYVGQGDSAFAGLVRGVVQVDFFQDYCGGCLGPENIVRDPSTLNGMRRGASLFAAVHQPAEVTWLDRVPAEGQCTRTPGERPSVEWEDVGSDVTLDGRELYLRPSRQGPAYVYPAGVVPDYDSHLPSTDYDLEVPGLVPADGFEAPGVVHTPLSFAEIEPAELSTILLLSDAANVVFTWGPSSDQTVVARLMNLSLRPSGDYEVGNQVVCHGADTGSLTVPANYIATLDAQQTLVVAFYRRHVRRTTLEDGSIIEGISRTGLVTFGVLQ